jgi:hypothetical protein
MTTPTAIYKKDYIKMATRLSFSTGEFNAPAHEVGRRNEFDSRLKSFGCTLPFWAAESHVSNTPNSAVEKPNRL